MFVPLFQGYLVVVSVVERDGSQYAMPEQVILNTYFIFLVMGSTLTSIHTGSVSGKSVSFCIVSLCRQNTRLKKIEIEITRIEIEIEESNASQWISTYAGFLQRKTICMLLPALDILTFQ